MNERADAIMADRCHGSQGADLLVTDIADDRALEHQKIVSTPVCGPDVSPKVDNIVPIVDRNGVPAAVCQKSLAHHGTLKHQLKRVRAFIERATILEHLAAGALGAKYITETPGFGRSGFRRRLARPYLGEVGNG